MSRHTAVAMMASLNDWVNTVAYVPMRVKGPSEAPSAVKKA